MDRGMRKAMEKLDEAEQADAGAVLKTVGMALVSSVGGAAAPCTGRSSCRWGAPWRGSRMWSSRASPPRGARASRASRRAARREAGDKTMVDALIPAVEALEQAGASTAALRASAEAAEDGMRATIPLMARKGRASYLGERSSGPPGSGGDVPGYLMRSAARGLRG